MLRYRRYVWQHRTKIWAWGVRRQSVREGFVNGQSLWQLLAVVLYGRRLIRKALTKTPELVATARLQPGAAVQITTIDPRTERGG